jgi:hypothetical protein
MIFLTLAGINRWAGTMTEKESPILKHSLTGGRFFEKQEARNSLIFERISFCSINIG